MDLINEIKSAIIANASQEERKYIGASLIGRQCNREIWYRYHGIEGESITPRTLVTFEIGHRLEEMLIDYIKLTGIPIEEPCESNNWLAVKDADIAYFSGHMDAVINHDSVLEIKTTNKAGFSRFLNEGLRSWSSSYYSQLQAYMGMSGLEKGVLFALNKDTSEFHCEWVEYDDIFYHELRIKALAIASIDEPPAKLNKNPTFYICNRCQFKSICHGA